MKESVLECLKMADKKKAHSIAFPPLGTGKMLGYPSDQVASIMTSAVEEYFQRNSRTNIKEVQIVIYPKDAETIQVRVNYK